MFFRPFEFSLDDKTYPAGEYAFSALKESVLVIEKDGRNRIGLFLTNALDGRDSGAQVRFQCYARQCFLSQVWIPGLDNGFQSRRSRGEREVAQRTSGRYIALVGTTQQKQR
jgi:hypothetical protein